MYYVGQHTGLRRMPGRPSSALPPLCENKPKLCGSQESGASECSEVQCEPMVCLLKLAHHLYPKSIIVRPWEITAPGFGNRCLCSGLWERVIATGIWDFMVVMLRKIIFKNSHFIVWVHKITLYLSNLDLDEHRNDLICGSAGLKSHTI